MLLSTCAYVYVLALMSDKNIERDVCVRIHYIWIFDIWLYGGAWRFSHNENKNGKIAETDFNTVLNVIINVRFSFISIFPCLFAPRSRERDTDYSSCKKCVSHYCEWEGTLPAFRWIIFKYTVAVLSPRSTFISWHNVSLYVDWKIFIELLSLPLSLSVAPNWDMFKPQIFPIFVVVVAIVSRNPVAHLPDHFLIICFRCIVNKSVESLSSFCFLHPESYTRIVYFHPNKLSLSFYISQRRYAVRNAIRHLIHSLCSYSFVQFRPRVYVGHFHFHFPLSHLLPL